MFIKSLFACVFISMAKPLVNQGLCPSSEDAAIVCSFVLFWLIHLSIIPDSLVQGWVLPPNQQHFVLIIKETRLPDRTLTFIHFWSKFTDAFKLPPQMNKCKATSLYGSWAWRHNPLAGTNWKAFEHVYLMGLVTDYNASLHCFCSLRWNCVNISH